MPAETDVDALFDAAAERGVQFVKGSDFVLEGAGSAFRLAYSGVTPEQIEEGVRRLAEAYADNPKLNAEAFPVYRDRLPRLVPNLRGSTQPRSRTAYRLQSRRSAPASRASPARPRGTSLRRDLR